MATKFELDAQQQARMSAWFKHHWEVIHKGWRPPDTSGFAGWYRFGPTMDGDNVEYECAWCAKDSPHCTVVLTIDDDCEFIYQYDENWNRIPAAWEKK